MGSFNLCQADRHVGDAIIFSNAWAYVRGSTLISSSDAMMASISLGPSTVLLLNKLSLLERMSSQKSSRMSLTKSSNSSLELSLDLRALVFFFLITRDVEATLDVIRLP